MNIKQIRELSKIVNETGLTALEINEGDTKIRFEKTAAAFPSAPPAAQAAAAQDAAACASPKTGASVDFNNLFMVDSPMVGVFYRSASPESEPFVEVGSKVRKGDVLCIIEAMKLMNEIVSDKDGEIVDICVSNGEIVEYGQTLFKIF